MWVEFHNVGRLVGGKYNGSEDSQRYATLRTTLVDSGNELFLLSAHFSFALSFVLSAYFVHLPWKYVES